ncbi:MAG: hypothetical protein GWM87_03115 [Xanthomonadales bacterium]|nr:LEA type 2 family protein [Xanthomonadales bacterium]NIX12036.1 hypothetical protein [Xanthomonadales bacterium]
MNVFTLAAAASLLLSACGAHVVKGEPPFVRINGLEVDGNAASLDLGVRNVNGVPLEISAMEFVISARDHEIARFDGPRQASVIANGSETLRFELPLEAAGVEALQALQDGETSSLPYSLEGEIESLEKVTLEFEGKGYLYPVPGRRGQFR